VDKKGNTVIEKDTHGEGIAGSTETHTKTETDRDGGTTTTRETTTKPGSRRFRARDGEGAARAPRT